MDNTELALNTKGKSYRIYSYTRCGECKLKTDNANIKLAYHEEGTILDKWFCPECYEEFRWQLLEFVEGRSEFIEILLFSEEDGRYPVKDFSLEEIRKSAHKLYEHHKVYELKFIDGVTYYKYK